jgi:hypothetical protein
MRSFGGFLLLNCFIALSSFGQADRANVTGSVQDMSGALIAGAQLELTQAQSGLRRVTETTGSGAFALASLPVGEWRLSVRKTGFRPYVVDPLTLQVGQTRTVDVRLEVATVETAVEVADTAPLSRSSAELGDVVEGPRIRSLPINGRNWASLMTLAPGAVDTGVGDGRSVRFLGRGGDDNNFRIDGADATGVRNQSPRGAVRLIVSADAIAEFRVNSALYSAETGGAPGGQVEVVSKGGSNDWHGSAFHFLRNSAVDARSPFDPATPPPFRLNQFGGTLGGRLVRDKSFFFASYEGLRQRRGQTLIGFVPSAAYRQQVLSTSPALRPLVDTYPTGDTATATPEIFQWNGAGKQIQDENVGLFRYDHRVSDRLTAYLRFSYNDTIIDVPNGLLGQTTTTLTAPTSGVLQAMYVISPRSTNEARVAYNYQPFTTQNQSRSQFVVNVPGFSPIQSGTTRVANGTTYSFLDNWSMISGRHTLKAGVEIKRLHLNVRDGADGTLPFANRPDFIANRLDRADILAELPTKGMRKTLYFGFIQDEIKLRPNLTVNAGLRYEFFNVFREIRDRAIPFDIQTCGGYCETGSDFAFPDTNNFAPRVSIAWSPNALKQRTVVRVGGGMYYGDAQLGDQYNPANNDALRYSLARATTPQLSFPVDQFLTNTTGRATAPRSMPRNKRNQVSQQWGLSIQHAFSAAWSGQIGYIGSQAYHTFNRTYVNVINPATGQRPFPSLDIIDLRAADGVGSFHGLQMSGQHLSRAGLLFKANYMWSHALNDGSAGGGDAVTRSPQNVACRSCEKGNSHLDARHVFSASAVYPLPFWKTRRLLGGWDLSGIVTSRTGLPVNVLVTRASTELLDGNTIDQRPDLVPGVSLIPAGGQTPGLWINPAAFRVPARGTWGTAGRNLVRGPSLYQFDMAVAKRTRLTEALTLEFRAEAFNLANRPQYGTPIANISSGATFGRITSTVNTGATGSGTPRQFQFMLRMVF